MIRLNVFIQVSAENRAAVLESAKELVAYSLKDNGCIAYDVFESATRSDVLMICETWKDAESLSAHEKADHDSASFHVSQIIRTSCGPGAQNPGAGCHEVGKIRVLNQ